MKNLFYFCTLIIVLIFSIEKMHAQVPRTISFQGVLADAQGNLVSDGNHQLQIVLYDQATFGNQVFIENQTVPVVKGIFNVIIGSVNPLPTSLTFDRAYFLGVSVDGGQELTPRTALTSVPYALRAVHANTADALAPNATGVVTKVNGQDGDISLIGGGSTTVTNNGNQFTISSTGGGGNGIQGVQNTDGTITVQNPNGPVATIGLANGSVTPEKVNPSGAASGQALMYNGSSVKWMTPSGGGSGVSSLNNLTNAVTLAASGGATVSTVGSTITINAGAGSGGTGIQGVQNTDNTLDITNPGGPTATINIKNQGVTTAKLADGAVTSAKIQDGQVQTNEIGNNAITSAKIASGQVVKSINTLKDDVTLAAGANITITPTGNTLTIASTGSGGGIQSLQNTDNTLDITNPNGPTTTANIKVPLILDNASTASYASAIVGTMSSASAGLNSAGVRGVNNTTNGFAMGVCGQADGVNAKGVLGSSTNGYGVYGQTTNGYGMYGIANANGTGVYGLCTNGQGVYGESVSGIGIIGSSVNGTGVFGKSTNNVGVYGSSSSWYGVYGYSVSGTSIYANGNFFQYNGTFEAHPTSTTWTTNKPATVKLDDGTKIKLFTEESTEIYFSDYGEGILSNGKLHIELDAKFLQTVTIDQSHPMKVFVQLEDECNGVFVTNKTLTNFDVVELHAGTSNARISYRVVCKRKYYEDERLATEEEDIRYNTNMLNKVWPEVIAEQKAQHEKMEKMRNENSRSVK